MPAKVYENVNPRDNRTKGEEKLLNVLKKSNRFDGWTVFEQVHINSMKPDFILLHPERGIIIIEVKDWNLNCDIYVDGGYVIGTDRKLKNINPIQQVENYKKLLLRSDLENMDEMVNGFKCYYGCIETVVYFHGVLKKDTEKFCGLAGDKKIITKIWTDDDIDYISNPNNSLNPYEHTYALAFKKSKFNQNGELARLVAELEKVCSYSDYNYERKEPFRLTSSQSNLAKLQEGSVRRWGGVAGSGKSLIVAEKAVRALKDGKRVVILTFNITLRHYLRDLCSQQFGNEGDRRKLRTDLSIMYFHELLLAILTEYGIDCRSYDYENFEDFTEQWIEAINQCLKLYPIREIFKYDYILIDEGQDFKGEWVRFLKKLFTKKGEFFVVYDKAQDIYKHAIWIEDSKQVKNIGFRGTPGRLEYTIRLPKEIVEKIRCVRSELKIEAEDILLHEAKQYSLLNSCKWLNCNESCLDDKLKRVDAVVDSIKNNMFCTVSLEDITILTTNEKTGAEIVKYFKNKNIKVAHVYDLSVQGDRTKRRNEKWKFVGGTGKLKVCSYHSYKGWQTPNILLLLDHPSTVYRENGQIENINKDLKSVEEAIFISMSRVKENSQNGQYSFVCMNYIEQFANLAKIFE